MPSDYNFIKRGIRIKRLAVLDHCHCRYDGCPKGWVDVRVGQLHIGVELVTAVVERQHHAVNVDACRVVVFRRRPSADDGAHSAQIVRKIILAQQHEGRSPAVDHRRKLAERRVGLLGRQPCPFAVFETANVQRVVVADAARNLFLDFAHGLVNRLVRLPNDINCVNGDSLNGVVSTVFAFLGTSGKTQIEQRDIAYNGD